ncbi:PREDICTED: solute carrier family 22 member 11 [Ceratotherium simum simum]|uniref:Solute carrier family 22 member 11 n=1 Tax=Ceratotherium simum simum TaxID=73337 RepID=A0ABM0I0R0_CERSS|nr:PREDICTED: solute carrier family 22 member 11 [Ceratotherium simum simum]
MAFSDLLAQVGGEGLFQTLQVFTLLLVSVLLPSQLLLDNFSAAVPSHRCWVHVLDNSSEAPANLTPEALLTVSIPLGPNHRPHQCRRFRQPQWQLLDPNATATNWSEAATEPCVDGWVYDLSTFTSTIVAEWDLVCDNQGLKPLGQSIFMTGVLVGSFSWGLLSYWLGRKPIFHWCSLQMAVASTSTIFAPNFLVYCGLRFLSALGLAGIILTSVTLMVEWTTTRRRALTMTMLGCTYSLGQVALGGLAFFLRDWRTLHLVVSTPVFATFLISWWLPESARWLIITGKPNQALQELKKVARINGHTEAKKTLSIEVLMSSMEEEIASAKAHQSVLDLFRVPVLRWRSLSLFMVDFALMFSYYGLVLDLQNLGSDVFLLQVLFGAVDFLGRSTNTFFLRFFGRRVILAGFQAVAGLSILANVLVPRDLQTLRVVFAVLGKGCFGVSLTCFTVYSPELFPTPLRMTANGFLQSAGRLGAVVGPLIMMTRQVLPLLPPISYGVIPIVSSLIVLFLPETRGLPLPDTIQDLESQRSAAARGKRPEEIIRESTLF